MSALGFLLAVLVLAGPAAGQQKFEPNVDSRREAIRKGQVKEFLSAMETMASEAEARKDWESAGWAYSEASFATRSLGQLEKALSHASKALDMGVKAKNPGIQANAIMWLGMAYADIGKPEKEREWLTKGLEIIKQIPPDRGREFMEGRIYRQLGQNYLLQNDTQRAIEYISCSVQALESYVSYLQRTRVYNPRARQTIQQIEAQIVNGFSQLGTAYLKAGKDRKSVV